MKILLVGIILFLVIMYIYTYMKYKKRKNQNSVSFIEEFNRKYKQKQSKTLKQEVNDQPVKYITKYNSTLDYIEWDDLIKESPEMKEPAPQKHPPKQLQF